MIAGLLPGLLLVGVFTYRHFHYQHRGLEGLGEWTVLGSLLDSGSTE